VVAAVTLARNGLDCWIERRPDGKPWMYVHTTRGPAPVSFEDWHRMIRCLGACETEKYSARFGGDPGSRDSWQRWTATPAAFFDACWDYDAGDYDPLRERFRLPR
jgi:hypothetical protein